MTVENSFEKEAKRIGNQKYLETIADRNKYERGKNLS